MRSTLRSTVAMRGSRQFSAAVARRSSISARWRITPSYREKLKGTSVASRRRVFTKRSITDRSTVVLWSCWKSSCRATSLARERFVIAVRPATSWLSLHASKWRRQCPDVKKLTQSTQRAQSKKQASLIALRSLRALREMVLAV